MKKTFFFALLAASAPAFALTTVQLKSGATIDAEVISEKADRIVVDLGFEVVTIPRDEIESLTVKKAGVAEVVADHADLYRIAANPSVLSVKENVDRVGEAVVLIRTPVGLGSGFLIHPSGYIVTNAHVVSGEYNINVTQFRRGAAELEKVQFNKVRIVAFDARNDLALLKIDEAGTTLFPTVPMGDGGSINDGQTVFAIGSPLGLDRTVSQGIVSARTRPLDGQ
ncbi:MAG: trypsin-like peptidase domain-containing protein, partial [Opitutaceae bacterium]|nr:trypsin-like peptidase domain-containing protein [Opitutaceae bacterium]